MSEGAKLIFLFLAVVLAAVSVFAVFSDERLPKVLSEAVHREETVDPDSDLCDKDENEETRAVWVTYKEIGDMVRGKSRAEYEAALDSMLAALKIIGINTLFWHARAFCDALYLKTEFPVSEYICDLYGAKPEYDPLEMVINKCKAAGIGVHAWVNPFRVCTDAANIPKSGKVAELLNVSGTYFVCESGVWLDPAVMPSQSLVLECISELCDNYEIAGIHFDDYFYPVDTAETVCDLYTEYSAAGGSLAIRQWRTESLSAFMSSVYTFIKSKDKNLIFSISPGGIPEKDYNESLADVSQWCSGGYADMIIPQIYYGLENENAPFESIAAKWADICRTGKVKLVCGLAAYKCGKADEFAGSGKNEWMENNDILKEEYSIISKNDEFSGFSLFSLSSLMSENGKLFS